MCTLIVGLTQALFFRFISKLGVHLGKTLGRFWTPIYLVFVPDFLLCKLALKAKRCA